MFGPLVPNFLYCHAPHPYRYEGDLQEGETVGAAAARDLEETIIREGPETVAAIIAEPVQGVGGVFVPPEDYFPRVRAICDQYDVLLIADEVICGFGRTGEMFALNRYGIEPDILAFAKGITSGYLPLGGIQINDQILDAMNSAPQDEAWLHGFTYSGHATCCAVGLRNIAIIEEEKLAERSAEMGARLRSGLAKLSEFGNVGDVRGLGLLCAVEFVKDAGDQRTGRRAGAETAECDRGARRAHTRPERELGLLATAGHQRRRGRSDRRRHRRLARLDV